MRLILVRHGQTDWNKEYRVQGQSDTPLNEAGRAQAEAIAQALKSEPVEAIYSSPLGRAYQTAQAIGHFHQVDIIIEERLKELDVGEMDGLYSPSLKDVDPDFINTWTNNAAVARWPGGETLPSLQQRVWGAVSDIATGDCIGSVILISHFFSLVTLLCCVFDLSLSEFRKFNLDVASISEIEFSGGKTRLVSFNDTCHLE